MMADNITHNARIYQDQFKIRERLRFRLKACLIASEVLPQFARVQRHWLSSPQDEQPLTTARRGYLDLRD